MNLLCAVENALVFVGKSGERADWFEGFSSAVAHDWFVGIQKFENSVASSDSAWSFVSHVDFVELKGASVLVGNVIFSANRHERLRTVGNYYLLSGFFHNDFSLLTRTVVFFLNVCSCDSAGVFVGNVVNTTDCFISPWAVGVSSWLLS